MINNYNKFLIFLLFLLFITVPVSFAGDNLTGEAVADGETLEITEVDNVNLSDSENNNVISASEVYFDASASSDGSGTQSSPYKTLSASKLGDVNYFASGTYTLTSGLSSFYSYSAKSFIGENMNTTVIRFTGSDEFISTSSDLSFSKITLYGASIVSTGGSLTATYTIFDSGVAEENEYGNSYGGAIKQAISSTGFDWGSIFGGGSSSGMTFDNCIFRNNYAAYGGAIYAEKGNVTISNSRFEKNHADNGGGAIAAVNGAILTITNCVFSQDFSAYDAGGAVYLFNVSSARIHNSQFNSCNASIGGAVASLVSPVSLTSTSFNSNKARWNGGAVFAMYGSLTVTSSNFYDNIAYNGGGVYADNLTYFEVNGGTYQRNIANNSAGAIFAYTNKVNKITNPTYLSNSANYQNDLYQTDRVELIIGSDDYEMIQYKSSYTGSLPSKYDLRTTGEVTPVKDQGESGNCWAFATMATLESAILKATGKTLLLSEGNLKNLACMYSDIGWGYNTNEGGMYPFALGYLTSWAGPVLAALDPTDDWDVIAPIINSVVHVQNILFLQRTSFTDNSAIKQAIMTYGAVCSEIYWSNNYLSGNNYYYSGEESRNHAICVVGWDDTKSISGAPGTGAWIIKNSYGTTHGDGGYYYVSYYDKSLFRVYDESYNSFAVVFNDTLRFNKNYQYDAAFTDYFMTQSMNKEIWYKNTFTSTGNDILSAFSTYFRKTTEWQAEIYVNDELKLTQSGSSNPGYFTFNLNQGIPLKTGDNFTISLKIKCTSSADIPISESGNPYTLVKEYFKPGVSYFSTDGVTWTDFYGYEATYGSGDTGHYYSNQVACLKAFTVEGSKEILNTTIEIVSVNSSGVCVNVLDQYGSRINTGSVEFIIDGERYTSGISNSLATYSIYLKAGSHSIKATYLSNQYYNASAVSANVTLSKETPNIEIICENIVYGNDLDIAVSLTNAIGETISVPVSVSVNGAEYTSTQFKVSDLKPQSYVIRVISEETSEFKSAVQSRTITVSKAQPTLNLEISSVNIGEDITIRATLSYSITANVSVAISSKSYTVKVNNGEGSATVENLLDAGEFTASGVFAGNDYYSAASSSKSFTVNKLTPSMVINDGDIVEGETAQINVYLPEDITGDLTLSINSNNYSSKLSNGIATFNIQNLKLGKYVYTVTFNGDSRYSYCQKTDSLEVLEKAKENLTFEVSQRTDNATASINVELPEDYTGEVTLILSKSSISKTPQNAKIDFQLNDLDEGEYSYALSFASDNSYNSASYSNSFVISRTAEFTIIAENMTRAYLSGIDFQATFTDRYGNLLENTEVVFVVNGNEYSVKTNNYGVARLNESFAVGKFNVIIENPSTGENLTRTMTIVDRIISDNLKMDYYDGTSFKVTVFGDNGQAVGAGEVIKFILNGKTYQKTTDKNGYASLKITLLPKTYSITTLYRGVKASNKIVIKQVLKAKNISKKKAKKVKFSAKLKTSSGKAISGKKIKFKVKSKTYIVKTNKKGVASVTLKNLKAGKYKVVVTYLKTSIKKTLTIKK